MEPTLHDGSYIVASRLHAHVREGDVVVFSGYKTHATLVKRVTRVNGDGTFEFASDNRMRGLKSESSSPASAASVLGKVILVL